MQYQHLLDAELAHVSLAHLTVARATQYLTRIFDSGSCEIIFCDVYTSPIELATDPFRAGSAATSVGIRFWGGPPGDRGWYEGSLITVLVDRLFQCVTAGEIDVVETFLEVLNGGGRNKAPKADTEIIGCA